MDIFIMDKTEIIRWMLTLFIGGAGWMFAFGRKVITSKVIEEASVIFVKRDLYDVEMRNVQTSIANLQLEQKANHADMIKRLDSAVDQINNKIDLLVQ